MCTLYGAYSVFVNGVDRDINCRRRLKCDRRRGNENGLLLIVSLPNINHKFSYNLGNFEFVLKSRNKGDAKLKDKDTVPKFQPSGTTFSTCTRGGSEICMKGGYLRSIYRRE